MISFRPKNNKSADTKESEDKGDFGIKMETNHPMTKLQAWRKELAEWADRSAQMTEEAEECAQQRAEATQPVDLLNRRLAQLQAQYNSLASRRDTIAREVEDAQTLFTLGLDTARDETARLAELDAEMAPIAEAIAAVEQRLDTINQTATSLSLRESELRREATRRPEGLMRRQRDAVVEEIHKAHVRLLYALREAVGFNGSFPESALNGQLERQAALSGQPLHSLLPDYLAEVRPIDVGRDGLLDGQANIIGAIQQPKWGLGIDIDALTASYGLNPEDFTL